MLRNSGGVSFYSNIYHGETFPIPTGIKIVLDQFQSTNAHMCDIVKVDIFHGDSDPLLKAVKKTGKEVFIPDVSNKENYKAKLKKTLQTG